MTRMQQLAISTLTIVTMCAIGLRTPASDFAVVWNRPVPLLLAMVVNFVVAPLIAITALSFVELPNALAVGCLICAASPGGPVGALFAMESRGDVATAVTAMVALSLLSVVCTPFIIAWGMGVSGAVDGRDLLLPMVGTLVIFQMVPLLSGMVLRRIHPVLAERLSGPATKVANLLLFVIVLGLLIAKGHTLFDLGLRMPAVSAALVAAWLGLGAVVSRRGAEQRAYSSITGVRNTSLALLISASYFPESATKGAILVFALFSMLFPFASAKYLSTRVPKSESGSRHSPTTPAR